jgi:parallel beta-helix repeat protein
MASRLFRKPRRLRLEPLESRLALTTFYVAPFGSDSGSGLADAPWQTLQKAADSVQAGDTVVVRAGNYAGFDLWTDGAGTNRIVFDADPGVTIDRPNARTPDGINLEGADYITIEGFNVVGMPRAGIRSVVNHDVVIRNNNADQNSTWGIFSGFSDDLLIEGNVASRSQTQHGIYVSNSGDRPVIRGNTIWGNYAAGIHMNGDIFAGGGDGIISGALVENNVIHDNGLGGGSGINADGVQNSIFRNNLIYNEFASGISLYQIDGGGGSTGNVVANNTVLVASTGRWALNIQDASTGNSVRNNILYNYHSWHGSIDISADSLSGFSSDYNVVMNRFTTDDSASILSLPQWQAATGQDMHSLVATPDQLFANAAGNDFHLSAASPAIDAGTSQFAPATDFEGTPRPSGNGFDIGADEAAGTTPVNQAPTDVTLSNSSVAENSPAGTAVGNFTAVDPNAGDTHTFTLLDNAGGHFALSGNTLVVAPGANLNYESAASYTVVVRATDSGGLSFDKSFTINIQNVNEVTGFDVQRGNLERSYIRYVDLVFESSAGLSQLVAEGRMQLTRYSLTGTGGAAVSLAGKMTVVGNTVAIDFGSGGIGGSRNSAAGDGYYRLGIDTDQNGSLETQRNFYRLLGDTNGDRVVNATDDNNVVQAMGTKGINLPADVNGDGVVNNTDRKIVRRQLGNRLASGLPLDD